MSEKKNTDELVSEIENCLKMARSAMLSGQNEKMPETWRLNEAEEELKQLHAQDDSKAVDVEDLETRKETNRLTNELRNQLTKDGLLSPKQPDNKPDYIEHSEFCMNKMTASASVNCSCGANTQNDMLKSFTDKSVDHITDASKMADTPDAQGLSNEALREIVEIVTKCVTVRNDTDEDEPPQLAVETDLAVEKLRSHLCKTPDAQQGVDERSIGDKIRGVLREHLPATPKEYKNWSAHNFIWALERLFEKSKPRPAVSGVVEIKELCKDGVRTDGSHHKQWYLTQIGKLVGADINKDDEGIAP